MRPLSSALIVAGSLAATQVAYAADLPIKAPPVVAPAYNWTGFYVGANIGGGWGTRDVDFTSNDPLSLIVLTFFSASGGSAPTSLKSSGVLGGLQLGYNWQFNRSWLLGLETDFDWSGIQGSTSNSFVGGVGGGHVNNEDEHIKWFGTVRARLGYLPTDNFLAYVTGGFAYGKVEHSGSYAFTGVPVTGLVGGFSFNCNVGATCLAGSLSEVATGWTLGGGLEYALWQKWTVKAEYLYVSLDGKSVTETALIFVPGTSPSSLNANYSRTNFNVARVGVNYRF